MTLPKAEYRHYRTGAVIMRMITKDYREIFGAPHMRQHRWDLQDALITRLAQIASGAVRCIKGHALHAFEAPPSRRHGVRYLRQTNADSVKGDEPRAQYENNAVSGPLGR